MNNEPIYPQSRNLGGAYSGLNKLEYFSGIALNGLLAYSSNTDIFVVNGGYISAEDICKNALEIAKEMMFRLEREKEQNGDKS